MKLQTLFYVWCTLVSMLIGTAAAQDLSTQAKHPTLLLVEDAQNPGVTVSWVSSGETLNYTMTMPYTAPVGGERIGESNVLAYATIGGTRIETGAGHPRGAVIRVGLTKNENSRAFFKGIDPGTQIQISINGVRFNQPVHYHEGTAMMHLKYAITDLKACALPGTARNQYLMSDPDDTLGARVVRGVNATPGALDGGKGHGSVEVVVHDDDPTLVDLHISVPYGLLRHLQDPWESDLPGTFFEPIHLHAEAEMIPVGVKRLNRTPILPEENPTTESEATSSED